jgi:flagellar hook protein FlgE
MMGSFQTGVSGLQQFQQDLEIIGNNIANVSTVGFKSARMDFEDTFSQSLNGSGTSNLQVGTGVATAAIKSFYAQGVINNTGSPTDLALSGRGFFVVRDTSSGVNYVTRDGQFNRDANGFLNTNDDLRVQGYTGVAPITPASPIADIQITSAAAIASLGIPATSELIGFNIDRQGRVNVQLSDPVGGLTYTGVIAQVVLQDFTNPQGLEKLGNNLYTFGASAGALAVPIAPKTGGLGETISGALESSNVDLGNEMASLITAQRAFQANAKIITTSDEVLQDLVNLKR